MGKLLTLKSAVIVYLQSPREKIWGVLLSINNYGITIRGIDINSFEDWSRSITHGEASESIGLSTMFIPMIRVEKVIVDETVGALKSFSDRFFERVGRDVMEVMALPELEDEGLGL